MERKFPVSKFNEDFIREKVVAIIAGSLARPAEEVHSGARLIQDLGMDSLDFMDILFLLEKEFGQTVRDAGFNRILRPDKSELARAGEFLSQEETAGLAHLMPALAETAARQPVRRKELFTFLTVDTLVRIVSRNLH